MKNRISLWWFLLATPTIPMIGLKLVDNYRISQPLGWQHYSSKQAQTLLEQGTTVLLFCKPTYHGGSSDAEAAFQDKRIIRLCNSGQFVPMKLEYNGWDGKEIRLIFQRHGSTKHPMIFIYRPDGSFQEVELFSSEAVLQALRSPNYRE